MIRDFKIFLEYCPFVLFNARQGGKSLLLIAILLSKWETILANGWDRNLFKISDFVPRSCRLPFPGCFPLGAVRKTADA